MGSKYVSSRKVKKITRKNNESDNQYIIYILNNLHQIEFDAVFDMLVLKCLNSVFKDRLLCKNVLF